MTAIRIRQYDEEDEDAVLDCMQAVWSEEPWDSIDRDEAQEELEACRGEGSVLLVAARDGDIVGFCGGHPLSEREHLPVAGYADRFPDGFYVKTLGLHEQVRGEGIGGRLLRALEDRLASGEMTSIHLKTEPGTAAYGFYKHMGYEETDLRGRKGRIWLRKVRDR